jgi:hypothetical protein
VKVKDSRLHRGARALRHSDPATAERPGTVEVWNELERARQARDEGDARLRAAVKRARAQGLSWRQIAAALGTSHQAAMQRYAEDLSSPPARPQRRAAG